MKANGFIEFKDELDIHSVIYLTRLFGSGATIDFNKVVFNNYFNKFLNVEFLNMISIDRNPIVFGKINVEEDNGSYLYFYNKNQWVKEKDSIPENFLSRFTTLELLKELSRRQVSLQEIRINLGNGKQLVASQNIDPFYDKEIFIDIETTNGEYVQPLAYIAEDYSYDVQGEKVVDHTTYVVRTPDSNGNLSNRINISSREV